MTQEEFEMKVKSMPQELRKSFQEQLEISVSKRIVNRFMHTVMQAYAQGQRATQKESHDGAYMRGAEDMLEALTTVSDMSANEIYKYFGKNWSNNMDGLYMVLRMNPGDILEIVDKYRDDKLQEKDEREKTAVQAMADTIGIERLCQIADEIRKEKEGDCLPF